ncbi:hypothetical protein OQA88_6442 [Cercophora sp. LCS_1]
MPTASPPQTRPPTPPPVPASSMGTFAVPEAVPENDTPMTGSEMPQLPANPTNTPIAEAFLKVDQSTSPFANTWTFSDTQSLFNRPHVQAANTSSTTSLFPTSTTPSLFNNPHTRAPDASSASSLFPTSSTSSLFGGPYTQAVNTSSITSPSPASAVDLNLTALPDASRLTAPTSPPVSSSSTLVADSSSTPRPTASQQANPLSPLVADTLPTVTLSSTTATDTPSTLPLTVLQLTQPPLPSRPVTNTQPAALPGTSTPPASQDDAQLTTNDKKELESHLFTDANVVFTVDRSAATRGSLKWEKTFVKRVMEECLRDRKEEVEALYTRSVRLLSGRKLARYLAWNHEYLDFKSFNDLDRVRSSGETKPSIIFDGNLFSNNPPSVWFLVTSGRVSDDERASFLKKLAGSEAGRIPCVVFVTFKSLGDGPISPNFVLAISIFRLLQDCMILARGNAREDCILILQTKGVPKFGDTRAFPVSAPDQKTKFTTSQ